VALWPDVYYIPTVASFGVVVVMLLTVVGLSLRVNRRSGLIRTDAYTTELMAHGMGREPRCAVDIRDRKPLGALTELEKNE
jgi:hypothetical protein